MTSQQPENPPRYRACILRCADSGPETSASEPSKRRRFYSEDAETGSQVSCSDLRELTAFLRAELTIEREAAAGG